MLDANRDTVLLVTLPPVYIFKPIVFKNQRQEKDYYRLVRDVKITLPIAQKIKDVILETYLYMQTLPTEEARKAHLKRAENGLKEQFTPMMKKLSIRQGRLLIKLVDRECCSTPYDLVKIFMGSFKAGFYQTFATLFGASLKKRYDPRGEDQLTEQVVLLVSSREI